MICTKMSLKRQEQRLILRIFFIVLFAIICFLQCYSIIMSYLEYPKIINMYDESPSLISILPGLTLCNNNRVSLKKLMRSNDTFRRAMEARFSEQYIQDGHVKSIMNYQKFNNFRDELAKTLERLNYNFQELPLTATLNEIFELRPDPHPFIEWFGCARTWKDSIRCENLTRVDSVTSRKCTTLLHGGAMVNDAYNRPELFNASSETPSPLSYFDAKEVIKVVLNLEPEDYADLKRQIGARLTLHSNEFVSAIDDLDFFVTRGYRYDFSIDRKDTKLIGKPYDNCIDYQKQNIDRYKERVEPRVPLSYKTCVQNCIVKNVVYRSNCWPKTMPYFRHDSLDPEFKLKFCPWFADSHRSLYYELIRLDNSRRHKGPSNSIVLNETIPESDLRPPTAQVASGSMRSYREIAKFCRAKCPLSCRIVAYGVSVTRSAWPTDIDILFDTTGEQRAKRHCCALIAIRFTHFHYSIDEYKPKNDVLDTIGDLGGLLAFWLGLSIVSIYHGLQKLVGFFSNRCSTNRIRVLT